MVERAESPPLLLSTMAAEEPLEEDAEEPTEMTVAEFVNLIIDNGIELPSEDEEERLLAPLPTSSTNVANDGDDFVSSTLNEIGLSMAAAYPEMDRATAREILTEAEALDARGEKFDILARLTRWHHEEAAKIMKDPKKGEEALARYMRPEENDLAEIGESSSRQARRAAERKAKKEEEKEKKKKEKEKEQKGKGKQKEKVE